MKKINLLILSMLLIVFNLAAQTPTPIKQAIGDKLDGGVVFSVSADGLHGLIAETQDQGSCDWSGISALIAKAENHSAPGKAFTDWRLPTREEATLLYAQKAKVGGLTGIIWTSTNGKGMVYVLDTATGKLTAVTKTVTNKVRAIRSF